MGIRRSVTATITGPNEWTEALHVSPGDVGSLSVTFASGAAGTVTLQRRLDGVNWRDVDAWTDANAEKSYVTDEGCEIRMGCKTADYTMGAIYLRLGVH